MLALRSQLQTAATALVPSNATASADLLVDGTPVCAALATALPSLGLAGLIEAFVYDESEEEGDDDDSTVVSTRINTLELVDGANFQTIHLLGSWAMECALQHSRSSSNAYFIEDVIRIFSLIIL